MLVSWVTLIEEFVELGRLEFFALLVKWKLTFPEFQCSLIWFLWFLICERCLSSVGWRKCDIQKEIII
jgi:hypothetical protein